MWKLIKKLFKLIGLTVVADTLLTGAMVKIGIVRKGINLIKNDQIDLGSSNVEAMKAGLNLCGELSDEMTIGDCVDACFGDYEKEDN